MPIKVLIIDDSALARQTISEILNSTTEVKVIATAPDPIAGVRKIHDERPDVIILDIEMARMDGLTFLKKMNETIDPIPCVICSALVEKAKIQVLHMGEKIPADIRLYPHPESMAPVGDHIIEQRPDHKRRHHNRHQRKKGAECLVRQ